MYVSESRVWLDSRCANAELNQAPVIKQLAAVVAFLFVCLVVFLGRSLRLKLFEARRSRRYVDAMLN